MTILIDHRIGSVEIAPHIPSRTPHEVTTLDFGDFAWMGNGPDGPGTAWIGVERKRLRDLLSSMESGRLANHQLVGMANAFHYSYLIVEGIWRPGTTGLIETPWGRGQWGPLKLGSRRFTASTMDNFTNALSCMLGVMIVFTPSLARTGLWLSNVYKWWTAKQWHQHHSCHGKVTRPLPVMACGKAPLVARILMELKGVGTDRAMKLAQKFPSVNALIAASIEEMMEVDGVGKVVAQGVWGELHQ